MPQFLVFAVKIAKVAVVILGLIVLFSLATALIGGVVAIFASFGFLTNFVFNSVMPVVVTSVSGILLIVIPIIFVTNGLLTRSFRVRRRSKKWARALAILWILSLISLVSVGSSTYATDFQGKRKLMNKVELKQPEGSTIFIETLDNQYLKDLNRKSGVVKVDIPIGNMDKALFDYSTNAIYIKDVILDVEKSETDNFELVQRLYVNGEPSNNRISDQIDYIFEQEGEMLSFNPYYSVPKGNKWRNQKLHLTLLVPEGKAVHFNESSRKIIYDVKNVTNTWDGHMINKTWEMTPEGLAKAVNESEDHSESVVIEPDNEDRGNMSEELVNGDGEIAEKVEKLKERLISEVTKIADLKDMEEFPELEGEVKKAFDFNDFSKLDFSGNFMVYVKQGDEFSVKAGGSSGDMEKMELRKSGSYLKGDYNRGWFVKKQENPINVHITMPSLRKIDFTGFSRCYIGNFKQENVKIELGGMSYCSGSFDAERIETDIAGASDLKLAGTTYKLVADVSGASKMDAYGLNTEKGYLDVSGAGSAGVNVSDYLNADLSGASVLKYKGSPPSVRSDKSGASSLVKLD